ncbi:unnamed protein product [Nippostrongylus brasiliensis]|uniref:Cytochrome c oxidase subunit VIb (inferred by orthology to a D. melanogaster protein) n=1 Tax=Nippostrongylus brasiliensis TaxID=27835 RepID=A0A0N4Y394_NIPBR|nr:unnamed protein product [Nippostrongylus brasiliensis]
MPAEVKVPDTFYERLQKYQQEFSSALRHPDSPDWFNKDLNEKMKKDLLWAAPYDARFPQVRKQRQCFAYYVDFHRCNELMGKDYKPCKFFQNVYKDFCPNFWIEKWDELIEEGRFPAKFDQWFYDDKCILWLMADSTRVPPEEIERRERFLRAGLREVNLMDPFTWPHRMQGAGVMAGLTLLSGHMYNVWNKKPYYFAIVPRLCALAVLSALGYGAGALREHHYRTRDALVQHYIQLHPEDFDHFNDRNGRPFSQILLPWYPRRTQYTKYN